MRDLALAFGFVVMIPYIFKKPFIGALIWIWTAFLIPNSFVFGFAAAIPFNFIVAGVTIFAWLISKEKKRIPITPTLTLLIIFAIIATISAAFSIGNSAVTWDQWNKFIKIFVFTIVVTGLINNKHRFQALSFAIALSLRFNGILEGLKFIGSAGAHNIVGPGASIFADNNQFALAVLCTIPIVCYLYEQSANGLFKIGIAGWNIVLFIAIVGTFSRGGLIGLAAVTIWAFVKSKTKLHFLFILLPLVFVLAVAAPDRWFNRMDTIQAANSDSSFMGRVIAWKLSTLIALDHPLLGGGFHAVQDFYVWNNYADERKFQTLSFIPTSRPDTTPHASHSIYFEILGDFGFIGLFIFLLLGQRAWANSSMIIKQCKNRDHLQWAVQLAQYLQYSLVAFFVAGAALSMAYFELIYVIFALLARLRILVEEDTGESTASEN